MHRIAISGHRGLSSPTAQLVGKAIRAALAEHTPDMTGISCLADGADQIFARAVTDLGGTLEAVIPAAEYREKLPEDSHPGYDDLIARAAAGMRDDEAVGSCLISRGDIGGASQGKVDEVAPPGGCADGREGTGDAEGAVRDVMGTRGAGPDRPVDPAGRRVGGAEVRLRREDGQLGIAGVQRAQGDAGVTAEQLEHRAPALTVEPGPHPVQGAPRRPACRRVTQLVVHRLQGNRHAGQAEVQRAVLLVIGRGGDGRGATQRGVSVAVVPEVPLGLQQRQHDSRRPVVQRHARLGAGHDGRPCQARLGAAR